MTSRQASNAIILTGQIGDKRVYGHDRNLSTDGNFEKGRIDGKESYYIVYSTPSYGEGASSPRSVIVDSQSDITFGFMAGSTQGWDKTGITLMEHPSYRGTGVTFTHTEVDITSSFPTGQFEGASSFIVMKGVWALYTGKNRGGTRIKINGVSEFGVGYKSEFLGRAGDLIQSIEYLRDN